MAIVQNGVMLHLHRVKHQVIKVNVDLPLCTAHSAHSGNRTLPQCVVQRRVHTPLHKRGKNRPQRFLPDKTFAKPWQRRELMKGKFLLENECPDIEHLCVCVWEMSRKIVWPKQRITFNLDVNRVLFVIEGFSAQLRLIACLPQQLLIWVQNYRGKFVFKAFSKITYFLQYSGVILSISIFV